MFEFPQIEIGERYDTMTITLGEWYEMGFYRPFDDESWQWDAYNNVQYNQLCRKFIERFYDREASIPLASKWKRAYLRKLNEIMPKYKLLYERVEQGVNPFQREREQSKSRDIFSDFPETLLSGNSDYASSGNDRESDTIREGSPVEEATRFARAWNDVDVMILDELDHTLFTGMASATLPML